VVRNLDGTKGRSCVVSDICPAMLDVAKRRAAALACDIARKPAGVIVGAAP
jgi:hypothetical protein